MPDAMHSACSFDRIEVVTGAERRRPWSLNEKLKAVEESRLPGMTVSYVRKRTEKAARLKYKKASKI